MDDMKRTGRYRMGTKERSSRADKRSSDQADYETSHSNVESKYGDSPDSSSPVSIASLEATLHMKGAMIIAADAARAAAERYRQLQLKESEGEFGGGGQIDHGHGLEGFEGGRPPVVKGMELVPPTPRATRIRPPPPSSILPRLANLVLGSLSPYYRPAVRLPVGPGNRSDGVIGEYEYGYGDTQMVDEFGMVDQEGGRTYDLSGGEYGGALEFSDDDEDAPDTRDGERVGSGRGRRVDGADRASDLLSGVEVHDGPVEIGEVGVRMAGADTGEGEDAEAVIVVTAAERR
ncbi:hypothetical protein HDU93_007205 [Gonapodya sp. JEL0774]|nr:hypothetical protein HDU93_007205 [Gonapodya sp. JEL0774]